MHSSSVVGNGTSAPSRQIGGLVATEQWWRDRYNEIAERGYQLRPRYHPNWQPSWLKSGKDFYTVEDGQPTIVRVAVIAFFSPQLTLAIDAGNNGRDPRAR
jgi:hypothetical protein